MPRYDYKCSKCERLVEDVFQLFEEEPLKKCPSCEENGLLRVMAGGLYASVQEIKTIGQLADFNAKKYAGEIAEKAAKEREENPPEPKPWYHGSASNKEISKMTEKQKLRYIMEGRK